MVEYNSNAKDKKKAEAIKGHYTNAKNSKMEQLRELDKKVRRPGMIVATVICIIGVLTMGAGMASVMAYNNMGVGLILSIFGLVVALISIPVYKTMTSGRKKQYEDQIIRLSNEITK